MRTQRSRPEGWGGGGCCVFMDSPAGQKRQAQGRLAAGEGRRPCPRV